MAVITVTGEPGCRAEEAARSIAHALSFDLVTESKLRQLIVEEYGNETAIPERVYPSACSAILAHLTREHPLVLHTVAAESLAADFPAVLRIAITASEKFRTGALLIDHRLERAAAQALLRQLTHEYRTARKRRFGRLVAPPESFDLTLSAESFDSAQIAQIVKHAAEQRMLREQGPLTAPQQAAILFRARLQLARHGIVPASGASLKRKPFVNDSEAIFANLLDFYRIAWEYEPKSFPIQWGKDGRVLESFTPDFYLPEVDLYVELTTMKQANVTRKNRKVKLLKTIYPHINIQVFYQKDFRNLVFKYGLVPEAERIVSV